MNINSFSSDKNFQLLPVREKLYPRYLLLKGLEGNVHFGKFTGNLFLYNLIQSSPTTHLLQLSLKVRFLLWYNLEESVAFTPSAVSYNLLQNAYKWYHWRPSYLPSHHLSLLRCMKTNSGPWTTRLLASKQTYLFQGAEKYNMKKTWSV